MIKEHNGSTWQGKAYSKIVDTTQQVTSFPVVVRPMENTIPSWTIKGNMVQDGTPTPQNPITPSECGERTGNLAYGRIDGVNVGSNGTIVRTDMYDVAIGSVESGKVYTINSYVLAFYTDEPTIGSMSYDGSRIVATPGTPTTFTAPITAYVAFRVESGEQAMLNAGSSPLPYEPYGYKLDIKSGNTTTPVYLGQVESTRKIKKLVITGQEAGWRIHQSLQSWFQLILSDSVVSGFELCTHYKPSPNTPATIQNGEILVNFDGVNNRAIIRDTAYTTLDDFKTYLQQQYANGTPVCVWYVLATPQTAVVNEPLMKIGTYADSVSGTNLSVTAQSPTTIDVDTSLKPSEMDLTYTGLKMCKRKKRVNGAWV